MQRHFLKPFAIVGALVIAMSLEVRAAAVSELGFAETANHPAAASIKNMVATLKGQNCLKNCAFTRDSCMKKIVGEGGLPKDCVQQYNGCRNRCPK